MKIIAVLAIVATTVNATVSLSDPEAGNVCPEEQGPYAATYTDSGLQWVTTDTASAVAGSDPIKLCFT